MSRLFFDFLFTTINKQKQKHLSIAIILTILIFLATSVLFISTSIQTSLKSAIANEPDFIVKRYRGGKEFFVPNGWEDKILNIYGVSKVTKRVYGRYYFDNTHYCLVVGVDPLDEQNNKYLDKILQKSDIKSFLSGKKMIVGSGVKSYLDANSYNGFYNFLTPNGNIVRLNILQTLPKSANLVSNDLVIVPLNVAKDILGINRDFVSDITFNVPSHTEWQNIKLKISELFFDAKVITKDDIKRYYASLFNYKGGLFLMLFLVTITTFGLVLYHRYSLVLSSEAKEIAVFRAIGWSIKDILSFKFLEAIMIFFVSFSFGVALAFIYVFYLGAPILKDIFLGSSNLKNIVSFEVVVDFRVLLSIFLLFGIVYIASILIPTWRIAITNPKEAMK